MAHNIRQNLFTKGHGKRFDTAAFVAILTL
jgi:hypothetical protein